MGDMAAIRAAPLYNLSNEVTEMATAMPVAGDIIWRQVLSWLAIPGLALAGAMLLTVAEPPRTASRAQLAAAVSSQPVGTALAVAGPGVALQPAATETAQSLLAPLLSLFNNRPFLVISAAAGMPALSAA